MYSQAEPWNVENVKISGKGIEVFQYARPYDHSDTQKGPKVLVADEFAWSVLFKTRSMKDICVREVSEVANDKHKRPSTFIELCFNYEGLPESKDSTQLKTKQPEDATMDDAGDAEAKGTYISEQILPV